MEPRDEPNRKPEVLAPAVQMADGYPIEQQSIAAIDRQIEHLVKWPYSTRVFLTQGDDREPNLRPAREPGDIFRQPDLGVVIGRQRLVVQEPVDDRFDGDVLPGGKLCRTGAETHTPKDVFQHTDP